MNTPPNEQPRYRPISVQDVSDYDPLHGPVRAKRVNFRLADGTTSYVVIPLHQYSADTVQQKLDAAATQHEEIMSIRPTAGGQGEMIGDVNNPRNPWG